MFLRDWSLAPSLLYHLFTNQTASEDATVDLALWIPLTVGLGLFTMFLMFAFAEACDRV